MPERGPRQASVVPGQDRVPPPSETVAAVAWGRVRRAAAGGAPTGPAAPLDDDEKDLNVNRKATKQTVELQVKQPTPGVYLVTRTHKRQDCVTIQQDKSLSRYME